MSGPPPKPNPNTRPERADKARNRVRIIEAASVAFAATGAETQMDDIAARAGVGVGTLYRHFATKQTLLVATVRRTFTLIQQVTREGLERPGEPFEVVKDVLRAGAEVSAADAVIQDALMRTNDEVWEGVVDIIEDVEAMMQVLITRAQVAGTMRRDVSAADMPMLMSGVSASMAVADWDWRRHLEIVLAGLSAGRSDRAELPEPGGQA